MRLFSKDTSGGDRKTYRIAFNNSDSWHGFIRNRIGIRDPFVSIHEDSLEWNL